MQKISRLFSVILSYSTFPFIWTWNKCIKQLPSVKTPDRRWALFQTLLSLGFFVISMAFAFLAFDLSLIEGKSMSTIIWILFVLGMVILLYSFGLGIYFYTHSKDEPNDIGAINKKIRDELKRIKEAEND